MEEGKEYMVYYFDGDRVRGKKLIFKKEGPNFVEFYNPESQKEESLPVKSIRRIEGTDGTKNN